MYICDAMEFRVTHFFRESNICTDILTNLGVKK